MLKAFVDDSGSGGDSPWYVLAGYVGTVEKWDSFGDEWLTVLNVPPKLEYFKSSEAESLRPEGQWAGIKPAERNARIDSLISVIGRHAERAIYFRVSQKDYNEVIKPYVPTDWDNAYYLLFMGIVSGFVAMEKHQGTGRPIEFVFDSNERLEKPSLRLYNQSLDIPLLRGRVLNVHYESDKDFLPLQAADLLAWQVRRKFCATNERPRDHFYAAMACAGKTYTHVLTRTDLENYGEAMERDAKRKWAAMGLPEELRKWKRPMVLPSREVTG
jgi:hypothetical protein